MRKVATDDYIEEKYDLKKNSNLLCYQMNTPVWVFFALIVNYVVVLVNVMLIGFLSFSSSRMQ